MSCSALSLLFITITSSAAVGVLCNAIKLYLERLFPAAGPVMLENSSKAACHLCGQIALISLTRVLLGNNENYLVGTGIVLCKKICLLSRAAGSASHASVVEEALAPCGS